MAIELIAKIAPKNDGFIGMVDADQVIGASGAGGYLPSSAISGVREYQLKISNEPSDGYYLQYKDSLDELTWAEVVGSSDVAWSGASEFYGFSSNIQSLYYPSSLGKGISGTLSTLVSFSSNSQSLYAPSGKVKSGYAYVQDGDTIAHGLTGYLPKFACVQPSGGSVNFGLSCTVDTSNITVNMTAPGYRDVFWSVSLI